MSLTPKQQLEQVNNPNLLSILSTIQGLPSQESLKHGAYVWKKYEHNQLKREDKTSVYVSTGARYNDSYNYIYSTSYTVDYATGTFTLKNPQTYSGNVTLSSNPPIAGKYIIAISSDKLDTYISDDLKTSGKELLFIPTDVSFSTSGSPAGRIVSKATSYTVSTIGDFLNFAVSDSPTAYPDGGEQGGYWYEKVDNKIDFGTITPTSAIKTLQIAHNLGKKPDFVFIYPISGTLGNYTRGAGYPSMSYGLTDTIYANIVGYGARYNSAFNEFTLGENEFSFNAFDTSSIVYYWGPITYGWIAGTL